MTSQADQPELGPWNPGLKSQLPHAYWPLSTMFRPAHVATSLEEAFELADFTGLAAHELVEFRPERLIVHELLIRVMADLAVPDGDEYKDLGINFRTMTDAIASDFITPHLSELKEQHAAMRVEAAALISSELDLVLGSPAPPKTPPKPETAVRRFLRPWTSQSTDKQTVADLLAPLDALEHWKAKADEPATPLQRSVYRALCKVVTAIFNTRGRLVGDRDTLISLTLRFVCNDHGSTLLGQKIAPHFLKAVDALGYTLLKTQSHPVVMNVKGASAAGKSTLRPLQRKLAAKIGIDWRDFALISPDIWRKYLLDYDSLGDASRYAGTLTGHEVEVIDRKLDRYMAAKGEQGEIPHLLIDRFRFDSFEARPDARAGSNLLTRFGERVFMFFVITPPDATVERAWKRGLQFGRYKAVDDLLHHNIEAYNGMPNLFFTWALNSDKRVHYEFLDNSVPKGTMPRTVAFGWNGEMNILDVKYLVDIGRYQKIDVNASCPTDVYSHPGIANAQDNLAFLKRCAEEIPTINLVEHDTGRIYARFEKASLVWSDPDLLAMQTENDDVRAGVEALSQTRGQDEARNAPHPMVLERRKADTLGAWGPPAE